MRAVRGKGNKSTEIKLCNALERSGILGWRTHVNLVGRPDIYFPWYKIAIFVDGCFWHGCPECGHIPKTNHEYWKAKINSNRLRDQKITSLLIEEGYKVFRFWEHELAEDILGCVNVIDDAIDDFFYDL